MHKLFGVKGVWCRKGVVSVIENVSGVKGVCVKVSGVKGKCCLVQSVFKRCLVYKRVSVKSCFGVEGVWCERCLV